MPSRRHFEPMYLLLALAGAAVAVSVGIGVLKLPLRDFVEYWAAGDVLLRGGNPYEVGALNEALRRALGDDNFHLTMMWNPPWTLPITVPFALVPIRLAHVLWVACQFGLVLLSLRMLIQVYGIPDEARSRLRAAAVLFPPTVFLIVYGQIGGACLFGIAGFLYFMNRNRPIPAGLCVALTAIKPHLLFAFGLYLVLQAFVSRPTRRAVLTGILAIAGLATATWLINGHVYQDYFAALNAPPGTAGYVTVREWKLPLASYWLRTWIAPDRFWVQFLPAALVTIATPVLWWKWRRSRDWPQAAPVLILLSLLAAPYGGWLFDLVLLLVPICHAAANIDRTNGREALNRVLMGLLIAELVVLVVVPAVTGLWLDQYVWFTPLVACGYAIAVVRQRNRYGD